MARAVQFSVANGTQTITTRPTNVSGISVREMTGTTSGRVRIFDAQDDTGDLVADISLSAGASAFGPLSVTPVECPSGSCVVVTGSVAGAVYLDDPAT